MGDAACWLSEVCPGCGRMLEDPVGEGACPHCGEDLPEACDTSTLKVARGSATFEEGSRDLDEA